MRTAKKHREAEEILQEQLEEKITSILRRHKEKIKFDPGLQMCLHCNYMPHKEKYVENACSSACFQRLEWNNTMPGTVWTEWGEWFLFRANRVTTSLLNAAFSSVFYWLQLKEKLHRPFLNYIRTWTMFRFYRVHVQCSTTNKLLMQ